MSEAPGPSPITRDEGRVRFGDDPELYQSARPPYPERVWELLGDRCGLTPGTRAFEVGPATGVATRELVGRGAGSVVAIEPDARLAAYLEAWAHEADAPVEVRGTTFESVRLRAGSFDLGVAATSFHWLDQRRGLRKVHRLLRPGGWWAMWWNIYGDPEGDAFHEATGRLMGERTGVGPGGHTGDVPIFGLDRAARLEQLAEAGFLASEVEVMRWVHRFSPETMRALYATFSNVTRLPARDRETLLDEVERVARDEFGGVIDRTMVTAIYTARKPL